MSKDQPQNELDLQQLIKDIRSRPEIWSTRLDVDIDTLSDEELSRRCDARQQLLILANLKRATALPDSSIGNADRVTAANESQAPQQNRETSEHDGDTGQSEDAGLDSKYALDGQNPTFGRFEVKSYLGQGSFATVYLAHDSRLGRDVALKIPRPEIVAKASSRDRFEREANLAASLSHPGIVPVFESGRDGAVSYIVLELCSGKTLADWLKTKQRPLEPKRAAGIVLRLTEAIGHAHQKGIIHRDLKPSNVMSNAMSDCSQPEWPQPSDLRITDFGLARREDESLLTKTGAIIGTPAYMAPEQAAGSDSAQSSPANDIYSLGVILYQLLTGVVPHKRDSYAQTIRAVVMDDVTPLRKIESSIPIALEAITAHCTEKLPKNRYASAEQLASDLRSFLNDEPVSVKPSVQTSRFARWIRANRALVTMGLVLVVLSVLVIGMAVSMLPDRSDALNTTTNHPDEPPIIELDDDQNDADYPVTLAGHHNIVSSAAFSSDGDLLVSSSYDKRVILWDWKEGTKIWTNDDHEQEIWKVCWSPDNKLIATAGWDRRCLILNAKDGTLLKTLEGHTDKVCCVRFIDDGKSLVTACLDGTIRFWDVESGTEQFQLAITDGKFVSFDLAESDSILLSVGWDGYLTKWNLESRQQEFRVKAHDGAAWTVAHWNLKNQIVTGGEDGMVRIFDYQSGDLISERPGSAERKQVTDVTIHPNDKWTLQASHDNLVTIWDEKQKSTLSKYPGHQHWVYEIALHPDGEHFASTSVDQTVKVWTLKDSERFK